MKPASELDYGFVQKGITDFDTVCHRCAIPSMVQQQAGKLSLISHVQGLIERVPALHHLRVELQLVVSGFAANLSQEIILQQPPARHARQMVNQRLRVQSTED